VNDHFSRMDGKNKSAPGRIVVLSGAGVSAESGLQTFRGAEGLWEGHDLYEVATPQAWERNPDLVRRFYNMRRAQVRAARPNAAHIALARLEERYDVRVITQNVDDLHERAGSKHVLHLHGEILKARSSRNPECVVSLADKDIGPGEKAPDGTPLRPHVVWFGEAVPAIGEAAEAVMEADTLIVVGTSMLVYPAAGLIEYAKPEAEVYVINPEIPESLLARPYHLIAEPAAVGIPRLVRKWMGE